MKEKDLDKNLDNLIIDGLIKEAEQDNADFEAAMRKMSEEEFNELIYEQAYANITSNCASTMFAEAICHDREMPEKVRVKPQHTQQSRWEILGPWVSATVAAAAVILVVLIPRINSMNSKLCESALYASEAYITSTKGGFDVSSASTDEIKEKLPALRRKYEKSLNEIKGSRAHYSQELQEYGWDLAVAYLKLHKKGDAIKVLEVLSAQFIGTPFGDHCQKILEQL